MAENFPNNSANKSQMEKNLDAKAERIKRSLKQLEMRDFDGIDESTKTTRMSIKAMGFKMTPVLQTDDEDNE
ncbi:MAG: hypothetical protein ACI9T8_000429 [Candidatus Saccharimonadales bacterium]|jgi:hypothetical protein